MIATRARDTRNLLVALDIGTSKIVTLVAEITPEDTLNLIGMGSHPSRGLKKGVVVNIESTVNAIQRSLEEAELMADAKIREVITGIAGSHIKSFNSHGMVAIKDKEVQQYDIDRVIETARAVNIPMEQQVLHILEQEFIIDGQGGVRQPAGMSGMRLEVKVHIVTGAVSAAQNIMKCVRRCGLEVRDLMLQPLASATAVVRLAREAIAKNPASALASASSADPEFSAKTIYNLAIQGDEDARRIFNYVGRCLGIVLSNLVNSLNLPIYVIGGGVSSAWEAFSPAIFQELRRRALVYAATAPPDPSASKEGASAHVQSGPGHKTIITRAGEGARTAAAFLEQEPRDR